MKDSRALPAAVEVRHRDAREELAEADERRRDAVARHDEAHGHDDEQHAAEDARRELLAEDGHAEKDRRHGLQRPENRRGRRTDVLDGARGAEERDGCREEGQRYEVAPQVPPSGKGDRTAEVEPHQKERESEEEHVEGHLERRQLAERGSVDPDDVDGIGERRGHDEQRSREAQRRAVTRAVEQADARDGQQDAERRLQREPFVEAHGHDERHHDGIDEEQRRGDAGVHVVVAQEERQRREREQKPQHHKGGNLARPEAEVPAAADAEHRADERDGKEVAEEEDRIGVHALLVEREGEEGVHAVGCGGDRTQQVAFGFGVHASSRISQTKIAFISPRYCFPPHLFPEKSASDGTRSSEKNGVLGRMSGAEAERPPSTHTEEGASPTPLQELHEAGLHSPLRTTKKGRQPVGPVVALLFRDNSEVPPRRVSRQRGAV